MTNQSSLKRQLLLTFLEKRVESYVYKQKNRDFKMKIAKTYNKKKRNI